MRWRGRWSEEVKNHPVDGAAGNHLLWGFTRGPGGAGDLSAHFRGPLRATPEDGGKEKVEKGLLLLEATDGGADGGKRVGAGFAHTTGDLRSVINGNGASLTKTPHLSTTLCLSFSV